MAPENIDPVYTPLFDRFESDRASGPDELARDIADILGARRITGDNLPGVLGWGLPSTMGMSPASTQDRERIAEQIADTLGRFEPRLDHVYVVPAEDTSDFMFRIEARLRVPEDESITLRILSPRRGGSLGAEVAVIGRRDGGTDAGPAR